MKNFAILIFLCALIGCQHRASRACGVDPEIFCSPFKELAAEMPDSDKKDLLALRKDEYAMLHFGLGMYIRNRFSFWEENELTRFFKYNGINHPDDASVPFTEGYVLYLRGEAVDMKAILEQRTVQPNPPASQQDDPAE